jgi:hypothetical protein
MYKHAIKTMGIYAWGHTSNAHYKREKSDRPFSWSYVPKNKPSKRMKRINPQQHTYELAHGCGALISTLEELLT